MAEKRQNCVINKTIIMSSEIVVPDIGDFESVEIIEVLVKPGDNIKKNDSIVTLESDKSSVEVPSPFDGKISSLKIKIGDKVSKGTILALIDNEEITETIKIDIKYFKQRLDILLLQRIVTNIIIKNGFSISIG